MTQFVGSGWHSDHPGAPPAAVETLPWGQGARKKTGQTRIGLGKAITENPRRKFMNRLHLLPVDFEQPRDLFQGPEGTSTLFHCVSQIGGVQCDAFNIFYIVTSPWDLD